LELERWDHIEEIFGRALSLEGQARQAYLDGACTGDPDLSREIAELLAEHASSGHFLDEPLSLGSALEAFQGRLDPQPELEEEAGVGALTGRRIGPYRLAEKLGQGGMGVVYRATRDDGVFTRDVAIKLLRPSLAETSAPRLEVERQILASLDHPHIARLLDGGTTADGAPYVVMEYVDGEPIDAWCDSRRLGVTDRIDLFLGVCEAVATAHRSLVVHRDLKPSNILVSEDGTPKLLDFGIAKLLAPSVLGLEGLATGTGQLLLTPAYASPEQLRGENVTVATDVYLLGVVLYRLLSGRLPYPAKARSLQDLERQIRDHPPAPPSAPSALVGPETGTEGGAATYGGAIGRDLDAIVLKALRPEVEARYSSVEQLMEDLRRYRRGLPVGAVQGTWRYRTRKLLGRHRVAVTVGSLLLTLVAGFAYFWFDQAHHLSRALTHSRAVEGFLEDFVLAADPYVAKGGELTVAQALERGTQRLEAGAVEVPELESSLRALLGRIFLRRGQFGQARVQLEEAGEILARRPTGSDRDLLVTALRAESDLAVARFRLAETEGEADAAEDLARQAARRARSQLDGEPEELLEILGNLAFIYCWRDKQGPMAPLSLEILVLARQQPEESKTVADSLALQGLALKEEGRNLESSEELYREALLIYLRLEGEVHPEVANLYNQLGLVAMDQGKGDLAFEHHQQALTIRQNLYPDGSHIEIAQSRAHLAALLRESGRLEEAETHLRAAVSIYQEHPDRGPAWSVTISYVISLAELFLIQERAAEAAAWLETEIPASWWTARPAGSRLLAWAQSVLGRAMALQGKADKAYSLLSLSTRALTSNPARYERQAEQSEGWLRDLAPEE